MWKLFCVEFLQNVNNIDDKNPSEQNITNYRRNPLSTKMYKFYFRNELKISWSCSMPNIGSHLDFLIGLKKQNVVEDDEILLLVTFHPNSSSGSWGESRKCIRVNQEARTVILVFRSGQKHNLAEDVRDLASFQVLFSGCRDKAENVLANQRPRRTSWFSDWPEKQKLGRGCWFLASCKVLSNSIDYSNVTEKNSKMY